MLKDSKIHQEQHLHHFLSFARKIILRKHLDHEIPKYYTWNKSTSVFKRRLQGTTAKGREGIKSQHALGSVYTIDPNMGEVFSVKLLRHTVRGPTTFQALVTFNVGFSQLSSWHIYCMIYLKMTCTGKIYLRKQQSINHPDNSEIWFFICENRRIFKNIGWLCALLCLSVCLLLFAKLKIFQVYWSVDFVILSVCCQSPTGHNSKLINMKHYDVVEVVLTEKRIDFEVKGWRQQLVLSRGLCQLSQR